MSSSIRSGRASPPAKTCRRRSASPRAAGGDLAGAHPPVLDRAAPIPDDADPGRFGAPRRSEVAAVELEPDAGDLRGDRAIADRIAVGGERFHKRLDERHRELSVQAKLRARTYRRSRALPTSEESIRLRADFLAALGRLSSFETASLRLSRCRYTVQLSERADDITRDYFQLWQLIARRGGEEWPLGERDSERMDFFATQLGRLEGIADALVLAGRNVRLFALPPMPWLAAERTEPSYSCGATSSAGQSVSFTRRRSSVRARGRPPRFAVSSIGPFYDGWRKAHRRLIDGVAKLSDDQLALRAAGSYWPIWALAGHLAGARVFWLCDVLKE